MQNGNNCYGGNAISVDYVTASHNDIIRIGRFTSPQGVVENLEVRQLTTSVGLTAPPKVTAPHDIWGLFGPTTVTAANTATTVATVPLSAGSWLIRLGVTGTASTGYADLVQWDILNTVIVDATNTITILPFTSNNYVTNGTFGSTSNSLTLVDGGSGHLLVRVSTALPNVNFRTYVSALASY